METPQTESNIRLSLETLRRIEESLRRIETKLGA